MVSIAAGVGSWSYRQYPMPPTTHPASLPNALYQLEGQPEVNFERVPLVNWILFGSLLQPKLDVTAWHGRTLA